MKKLLLLFWGLMALPPVLGQPLLSVRESSDHWAERGQALMRTGHYAEAYTAFQLARGLGASNMAAQMELAKKRNINSIQFRALISEARLQASADPTQSLRLLEYAHQKFPDSTIVLKILAEVANQPANWYYTLQADSIRASPQFTYLLADTDKTRLYYRRGDSLTLIHTFAERPILREFAADDRYLFVTTGKTNRGMVYALHGSRISPYCAFSQPVVSAAFSPGKAATHGSWLLLGVAPQTTWVVDLATTKTMLTVSSEPGFRLAGQPSSCRFSPSGRYLITPDAVWQLAPRRLRKIATKEGAPWSSFVTYASGLFSPDERQVLFKKYLGFTTTSYAWELLGYNFSESGDTLRPTGKWMGYGSTGRNPWQPFSADSRYLSVRDSLYRYDQGQWQPVRLEGGAVSKEKIVPKTWTYRFSPDSSHLLVQIFGTDASTVIQLWRLKGHQPRLVHEFINKESLTDDVFSADGTFLLSRETDTDQLWHIGRDELLPVHTFSKSFRMAVTFDQHDYPPGSTYFSPGNRYLLTYSANSADADSLWELIKTDGSYAVQPVRGFAARLNQGRTRFSPDEKWLLTEAIGAQPARLWNLKEQQVTLRQSLSPGTIQAAFSPQGNYLLTFSSAGALIRKVANRTLTLLNNVAKGVSVGYIDNCLFSSDERYVANTQLESLGSCNLSWLYGLQNDGLKTLRQDATTPFHFLVAAGEPFPAVRTYQTGLFSPDGSQWLQTQTVWYHNADNHPVNPDTLWNLTATGPAFAFRPVHRIDRYAIESTRTRIQKNVHMQPAALFARDGRFLMTRERAKIHVYQKEGPTVRLVAGPEVTGKKLLGWPLDVSANADYWLIRPDPSYAYSRANQDRSDDSFSAENYEMANTPDSVQIWRRSGTDWRLVASLAGFRYRSETGLYEGMNRDWLGSRRQSWFSPAGNYLLLPTLNPGLTTLFSLASDRLQPVAQLKTRLLNATLLSPDPAGGREVAVLYTTTARQTSLFRYGAGGSQTISLGYGTLEYPPRPVGRYVWWVRRLDDSQQTVELLDVTTGQTMVRVPFGGILDYTVRPNGNAWAVSAAGARLIRCPDEILGWLQQAPVAPLQPTLRQLYSFL